MLFFNLFEPFYRTLFQYVLDFTKYSTNYKRVVIGFMEIFTRFSEFLPGFLKYILFWLFLVVSESCIKKRCFSMNWNYLKDTELLFKLCFILLQRINILNKFLQSSSHMIVQKPLCWYNINSHKVYLKFVVSFNF